MFHEIGMPITASAIVQRGALCRNFICIFQEEMLSNFKLKKASHVGFSGEKITFVMTPGNVLLRRWQGPISVFHLRLEEVEVTEIPAQAYSRDDERVAVQCRCLKAFLALTGMRKHW